MIRSIFKSLFGICSVIMVSRYVLPFLGGFLINHIKILDYLNALSYYNLGLINTSGEFSFSYLV